MISNRVIWKNTNWEERRKKGKLLPKHHHFLTGKRSREAIADEYMKREEAIYRKTDEEFSTVGENLVSETASDTSVPTVINADTSEVDNAVKEEEAVATKVEELLAARPAAVQEEALDPFSRDTIIGFNQIPGHKTAQEEAKEEEDEDDLFHRDLERLKAAQRQGQGEEAAPSVDEDIEIFKKVLYAEQVPITVDLGHYVDVPSSAVLEKEVVAPTEKPTLFEDEQASLVGYRKVKIGLC